MIIAKKWSKGSWISTVSLAAALLAPSTMAFAAANTKGLVSITLQGVGTGAVAAGECTSPAIACAVTHECQCFTGAQTILGDQGFNNGSLTFELSVDTTAPRLPISTSGTCLAAGGFATIANKNGKKTLSIDISGLVCPTVDGSATMFNGTYNVTGGKFSAGTGTINASLVGTESRSSLNGNVQP